MRWAAQMILNLETFCGPVSQTAGILPLSALQLFPVTIRNKLAMSVMCVMNRYFNGPALSQV